MNESLLLWGIGLLGASVLLLIIELFIPSAGIIGATAAVIAIAGDVCLFRYSPAWGLIGLIAILVVGPSAFFFWAKVFPSTPMGRKLLLGGDSDDQNRELQEQAQRRKEEQLALIGAEGVAITALRPVGVIRIDGERFDALAERNTIDAGTAVEVTSVDDNQVKVRAIDAD